MNCIHLDFHTSPDIGEIGTRFDKKKFTETVKKSGIDLMTVFAKCHHGYAYYPSKITPMHPGLNFNLLKEQIEAIHDAGAKAPIYITVGWNKLEADSHPEWHQIDFYTHSPICPPLSEELGAPLPECYWVALCPTGGYLDYVEEFTKEVCENFDVSDGIFFDICFVSDACVCDNCKRGMIEKGLDPDNHDHAAEYYRVKHIEMMKRLTSLVHSYSKNSPVFYNGGADMNRTEYHPYQTHYELEDLPTAWGGYDLMPLRAKFFEKYGKHYLGMTGKFNHSWGEFGGFKNKEALRYECCDMLSVGASISVGDHLHPSGELDESTYATVAHAFGYVNKIKDYCYETRAYTDVAIILSHSFDSDIGLSKLLQNMHLEYDTVEPGDSLDAYKYVILPDSVAMTEKCRQELLRFVNRGGSVIASYASIFDELGVKKIAPSDYDIDYIQYNVDEYTTPFLSYESAYRVECDGEQLAYVYEPYFSRTAEHFCGHKNTPNKLEAADYPALVKRGNVLYFAHPVFRSYNKNGSYVLERYITSAIERVLDKCILTENLPSVARVRLRASDAKQFIALHLLYAPPVNRGNVCLLPDFPTLYGVKVKVKTDKNIKRVVLRPEETELEFTYASGYVEFLVPPFNLHSLITIEW